MKDLLDRYVARKVTQEELNNYSGSIHYLAHHAVWKPSSKSTKCRIVFDSKAPFHGISLNDCLAKGPSLLNSLLGVLLRFRQYQYAFIGDIRKMFHAIDIPVADQMMHLFVWRDCSENNPIETFAMTVVNMGDRPSATIAQLALQKTAEMDSKIYPDAAKTVLEDSYMDDILGSTQSGEDAVNQMRDIDQMLNDKGFKIKEWIHNIRSSSDSERAIHNRLIDLEKAELADTEGVLGLQWNH